MHSCSYLHGLMVLIKDNKIPISHSNEWIAFNCIGLSV